MRILVSLMLLGCLTLPSGAAPDGKALYDKNCAGCHGATGKGDGEDGSYYNIKPADLTPATYKHGTDDATVMKIIAEGLPNTPMDGSPKLSDEERQALVDYLKTLRK